MTKLPDEPAAGRNDGSKLAPNKNNNSMLASYRNNGSKLASNRNDDNKPASSRNNDSKPASGKNNGNGEVNRFDGNGVEHTRKSRKLKKSFKSRNLKGEKMFKS